MEVECGLARAGQAPASRNIINPWPYTGLAAGPTPILVTLVQLFDVELALRAGHTLAGQCHQWGFFIADGAVTEGGVIVQTQWTALA